MTITGQIKVINETQTVSDKFKKREFVLTTDGSTPYPQHVSMQLTQDKCSLIDQFAIGQEVEASFNLRGREWNSPQGVKYFNTIDVWAIKAIGHNNAQNSDNALMEDLPF